MQSAQLRRLSVAFPWRDASFTPAASLAPCAWLPATGRGLTRSTTALVRLMRRRPALMTRSFTRSFAKARMRASFPPFNCCEKRPGRPLRPGSLLPARSVIERPPQEISIGAAAPLVELGNTSLRRHKDQGWQVDQWKTALLHLPDRNGFIARNWTRCA